MLHINHTPCDTYIKWYIQDYKIEAEIEKKNAMSVVDTSLIDGGESWNKGFATGFAGLTVSGTETYIKNQI